MPHFVCWDENPNAEIAANQAQFSAKCDADAFYDLKTHDVNITVWQGVLGKAVKDGHVDWFHTRWRLGQGAAPGLKAIKQPEKCHGVAWTTSNLNDHEAFRQYTCCCGEV
ncbi:hypothetical protein ACFSE1_13190 [Rhizobium helianthi]|uniref:Uncharacterized protein n=1 Tax=Rhizobium helianthi TaxID=1132695 RepID=A0ABW4M4N8_9HYPH